MWKKPDEPAVTNPPPACSSSSVNKVEKVERTSGCSSVATLGQSICVKGEVTGAEDLVVDGCVEGMIDLKQNCVTIGKGGRVKANIFGKIVQVHGEVVGDITGTEQIVIHESGSVRGNVSAPRVSLKDGARLKGAINTDSEAKPNGAAKAPEQNKSTGSGMKPSTGASGHAIV